MLDDVIIHEIERKEKERRDESWRQIQLPVPQYDPYLTPPSKEKEPRRVIEIEL